MALTVTPTDEMKTLKVGEKIYEIVDDEARTDLNEVKADFLQLEPSVSAMTKSYLSGTVTVNAWKQTNLTDYSSSFGLYLTCPVTSGQTVYISGTSINSSFPLAVFVSSDNTYIGKIYTSDNAAVVDYKAVIPDNCTTLIINGRKYKLGAGWHYPSVYTIDSDRLTANELLGGINSKQTRVNAWDRVTAEAEEHNAFVYYQSGVLRFNTESVAGGYAYAKIAYDKTKTYRFWGQCKTDIIPILLCCDADDNIITTYGVQGDVYKGHVLSDIPETTEYIYINGNNGNLFPHADTARERSLVSLIDSNVVGVFLGDSITQGANVYVAASITPYEDFPSVVGNTLGCVTYNGGLGGGTYGTNRSIDFRNVVDCIINHDASSIIAGIDQYSLNASAEIQWNNIMQLDFNDVDFVVLSYGTNDWNFGTSAETVKTGMRTGIANLLMAYPHLKIYVLTPIFRFNVGGSGQNSDTYINPTSNLSLYEMCEAIMDCAKEFNLPCKDMYYTTGINSYTYDLYMGDGTHPNANGYAVMGNIVSKFLNSN